MAIKDDTSDSSEPAEIALDNLKSPNENGSEPATKEDEPPSDWRKINTVMCALYLTMFLVALDRTIIGTALPQLTHDFHSINDVGWYASAYLITSSAFQLVYSRIYTFYAPKWVLMAAVLNFELGSIICGAAPNSAVFIVGRAIAGLGGAGIFNGVISFMVSTVPLHKRPTYQGVFGAVFGIANVSGPLLGGAVAVAILLYLLEASPNKKKYTIREQIKRLDPYGTLVFLPGVTCLILSLQWGGSTYAWNNPRIIVLLVLSAILLISFIIIQFRMGEYATIPIRIIKQRSILSGMYFSLTCSGAMFILLYFLSFWFQAVKGVSAAQSGINSFPLVLALTVALILSGIATRTSGYYVPQLILSTVMMSIGCGLLLTLTPSTPAPKWIGYQIIFGFGLGLGMQAPGMSAQIVLGRKDVITGVAIMFLIQGLGGSIWIAVAQALLNNSLASGLSKIKGIDADRVFHSGATQLAKLVPPTLMASVFDAYNNALVTTFKLALGCACATIIAGLTMEWRSISGLKEGGDVANPNAKDEEAGTTSKEEVVVEPDLGEQKESVKTPETKA